MRTMLQRFRHDVRRVLCCVDLPEIGVLGTNVVREKANAHLLRSPEMREALAMPNVQNYNSGLVVHI